MKYSIETMIKERAWRPGIGCSAFDSRSNYAGPSHDGYVYAIAQHRDSEVLDRSNFAVLLDMLGGESACDCVDECTDAHAVKVVRVGHWAVGWVEQLLVHTSATTQLETLRGALESLDDYPVLDESEYSQMEFDEQSETLECYSAEFAQEFLKFLGFSNPKVTPRVARAEFIAQCVDRIYRDDCGYRGEGWVTEKSCQRWIDGDGKWELYRDAEEGNRFAAAIIARFDIQNPNSKESV